MEVYIQEIVSYLKESFKGINHLYIEQHIASISLDISQAVSVGLIINEAVTNCIKYAFPANTNGMITVTFAKKENEDYCYPFQTMEWDWVRILIFLQEILWECV